MKMNNTARNAVGILVGVVTGGVVNGGLIALGP